jgi:phosphoglycerate dehydrogenase-like enzyme
MFKTPEGLSRSHGEHGGGSVQSSVFSLQSERRSSHTDPHCSRIPQLLLVSTHRRSQSRRTQPPSPAPVTHLKRRRTKIFVPETAYHHVFEALPEGMRLVAEPEPDVELAVLGMHHAEQLPAFLAALPGLQAVQSLNAGVDWLLPHLPEGVAVYNASGVHDAAVSEWVVAVLLAMRRRLPDMLELQRRGEWDVNLNDVTATGPSAVGPIDTFEGGTVLIIGYGSIGRAVAARLAPFGIRVFGIARHRRADAEPMEALPGRLAEADAVVLLLPLTPETEHIVDADFLARMKPGSILVNAARGRLVDTEALLAALHRRRIRAALDVTDPEPLPPGHPLWQAPNVMITPHVAGAVESWRLRAYRFANEQVRSFAAGAPLKNIVSRC